MGQNHLGINGRVVNEAAYWTNKNEDDVNVDDINNTIRFREEADDMQVGQIVMIGRTVWVVRGAFFRLGAGYVGPFQERPNKALLVHRDLCR